MTEWTDSAKKLWVEYNAGTKAALEGTGADAQEVLEDLKRHVDEEASAAKLGVVTEEDLRKILAKIGPPEAAKLAANRTAEPIETAKPAFNARPKLIGAVLFFF